MKKRLFLLAMCLISVGYSYSQTTLDEYNYCKKGYWNAFDNGYTLRTDIKLMTIKETEMDGNEVKIFRFQRCNVNPNTAIAYVYFIKYNNNEKKKSAILVIPDPRSEDDILRVYYKDINNLDNQDKLYIMAGITNIMIF